MREFCAWFVANIFCNEPVVDIHVRFFKKNKIDKDLVAKISCGEPVYQVITNSSCEKNVVIFMKLNKQEDLV